MKLSDAKLATGPSCSLQADVAMVKSSVGRRQRRARVQRVFDALHEDARTHNSHSQNSLACSLHDVNSAWCVPNSFNSAGDGTVRGWGVCVLGETKPLSTSTRCGVRRSAVDEYTHPQQTPLSCMLRRGQAFCETRA